MIQQTAPTPTASIRRKLMATLFGSVGITRTGFLLAATVTALAADEILGSATWAGLPAAAAIIGVAIGTAPMSAFMARHGRRRGMVVGQTLAVGGAVAAAVAATRLSFLLLLAAMLVLGLGNSADRLARYAAADITPVARRSSAIALIVWAGTIGSVVGPALLAPAQEAAEALGLHGLSGPYLLGAALFGLAGLVVFIFLRPDPLRFVVAQTASESERRVWTARMLSVPTVRVAVTALVVGQVVMVLIMTMTPVHIRNAGQSLGAVGLVISAHTLGMFAVSPLTGYLSDRFGRLPIVIAGQVLLATSAVLAAFAAGDDRLLLVVALFLLGLGWNFGFVAASALLIEDVAPNLRLRLQGAADSFVWMASAAASLVSGILLGAGGYALLSLAGAALVVIPAVTITRNRDEGSGE